MTTVHGREQKLNKKKKTQNKAMLQHTKNSLRLQCQKS